VRSSKSKLKPKPNGASLSHFEFEAIGTVWNIDVVTGNNTITATALLAAIKRRIAEFDKHYSRFRQDSLVTKMAKQAGDYELPPDARPLFDMYEQLYKISGGLMTPLIGSVLEQAGYDAAYSLQPKQLNQAPSWDETLVYDFPRLLVKRPALLDLGAAGKGYLVDIVGDLLRARGFESFCIDAGGDSLQRGMPEAENKIGLEHPDDPTQVIGIATVNNQSLCGSAGNRRAWGNFHHIINPRTLSSPRRLAAVWVTADNALLADTLSTALFFVSPEILQKHYAFEYAIMQADNSLRYSTAFPAVFFS
jgi:thiamine biosynthesis lipoprotein